jgi:hypothetical protein
MTIVRSAIEILNEIRRIKGLQSDAALGEIFGISQSTVASWRSRNSLPYEIIIEFCVREGISTDKLLLKQGPVKIGEGTLSYEVDDLFATRLSRELKGRTTEWLSFKSKVDKRKIEDFISKNAVPTVDELEAITSALGGISVKWLAERSPHPSENWLYEFYRENDGEFPFAQIYKMYLIAAEQIIDKMQGLIALPPELKADVINTACRVHLKETPDNKEVNYDLISFLLTLAR